jgi:hypothetical protein
MPQWLFGQSHDTQRQTRYCGSTASDSTGCFPVILGGAFHAGVGMNQSALIVVYRYTWRIVRATSKQRSEKCNGNESFHDVTSVFSHIRHKAKTAINELVAILPPAEVRVAGGIISNYVNCKNHGEKSAIKRINGENMKLKKFKTVVYLK